MAEDREAGRAPERAEEPRGERGGGRFGGERGGGGRFGGGGRRVGGRGGPGGPRRGRACPFCEQKCREVDYKNADELRRFLTERGKIKPRRKNATCAKHQRRLAVAIKRARHLALLPFSTEAVRG